MALALGACGGGSDGDRTEVIEAALPSNFSAEVFWELANEGQQERFADGVITFTDYERAVFAFLECVEDEGAVIRIPPRYDPGTRQFEYEFAIPGQPEQFISQACGDANLLFVDLAWQERNAPSVADLERARRALAVCLRDAGHDSVPDLPSGEDYRPESGQLFDRSDRPSRRAAGQNVRTARPDVPDRPGRRGSRPERPPAPGREQ